jgi:hypothetical protein
MRRLQNTYIYMDVFIIKLTYYCDFLVLEHLTLAMSMGYDGKMPLTSKEQQ